MFVSFKNWKGIRVVAIGCCLTFVAMQASAPAQLFKRRGARQNQPAQNQPAQAQPAQTQPAQNARQNVATRPNAPQQNRAQTPTDAQAAAPPVDMSQFQVPNTTNADELVKYLSGLLTYRPKSKEEAEAYRQRAPQAMTLAAQKILVNEKDQTSDNYKFAEKYLLAVDVMSVDQATTEEKQELLGIIIKNLRQPEMDADDLDIAVAFTEGLEMSGDKQMASTAYKSFAEVFSGNKDPMIIELGQLMAGSARRLSLIGNTINVQGTTLAGEQLNWNAYRGKVVLIDFWATWCGPCIREMPNVKKNYEAYHNRGFEVIGVCMNEKREQVDAFFEKNEIPWVTLFDGENTNPTALYYGISSLPTTILVDQQGRVVTLSARGKALDEQLEKLLGPAS